MLSIAVHNIILNNGNDYDLTEEQKKLLQKTNNEINKSHFKKKLEGSWNTKVLIILAHILKKLSWYIDNIDVEKLRLSMRQEK